MNKLFNKTYYYRPITDKIWQTFAIFHNSSFKQELNSHKWKKTC